MQKYFLRTCFTCTKARAYQCKSTNTDGPNPTSEREDGDTEGLEVYAVYLLYWFKSTNTDAADIGLRSQVRERGDGDAKRLDVDDLCLLALLVQKYKY